MTRRVDRRRRRRGRVTLGTVSRLGSGDLRESTGKQRILQTGVTFGDGVFWDS